jgi:hypothetical protein
MRGADGDEFATGKWELASCQCPHPRTIAGGIEQQPDERLNGRHFPPTRQAELRTPGAIACVPESRYVLTGTAQLLKEGSVPGDGWWTVAASPDHKRDSARRDRAPNRLPRGRRSGHLRLYLRGPVAGRREDGSVVGGGRSAAAEGQS